ncbi:NUDIX domain-containing protein [Patescibacteria group bacterium]|nr:NUDIX domain-containing protein [Patescibacteria group bacterium]
MMIPVVNESDIQIASRERDSLLPDDMYRASALWLLNLEGKVLLARRALSKKHNPGRWGCSVAGTVEEGETYQSNILKETEEEIGLVLTVQDLHKGAKLLLKGKHNHFCQFFFAQIPKTVDELIYDEKEVMGIRWISIEELLQDVQENPESYSVNLAECRLLLERTV